MVFKEMGMNEEERTNVAGTFRDAEAVDGGAEERGCLTADPGRNAEGREPGRGCAHLPADGRTGCGWASREASPSSPRPKATASPNASSRPSKSQSSSDGSFENPGGRSRGLCVRSTLQQSLAHRAAGLPHPRRSPRPGLDPGGRLMLSCVQEIRGGAPVRSGRGTERRKEAKAP